MRHLAAQLLMERIGSHFAKYFSFYHRPLQYRALFFSSVFAVINRCLQSVRLPKGSIEAVAFAFIMRLERF